MRPTPRPQRSPRAPLGRARLATLAGIGAAGAAALLLARPTHPLGAQDNDPTFAADVAPVIIKNCAGCHHDGGMGPFSLLNYDTAKAHIDDIEEAVKSGYMPPWHADGPKGVFRNDRRLDDREKSTILKWIKAGGKAGDPRAMPASPTYPEEWEMGQPDAIVSMPESFLVPASGTVEYMYFEVPTGFTEDKWVQAMEFKPGAREVVHHVLVYAKVPPPAAGAARPAAPAPGGAAPKPLFVRKPQYDPPEDPPRKDTLHGPPQRLGTLIGGTAPGTNVMEFPAGTAARIRAGTILTFQMHYTAKGHAMHDRTSVGFRFAKAMPDEEMRMGAFANGNFTIPAGKKDVAVEADLEPTEPIKIWGLLPHTHLRGSRWKYTLEKPDGSTQVVLDVPRYDFNWQTYYFYDTPLDIPAGAKLRSVAWYDNTRGNKSNPDPRQDVHWGDQTWEEMQYTGFLYTVPSRRLKPAKGAN
jgi:mono/diheme cytochrome c family protein